jgi:hypothetical protein
MKSKLKKSFDEYKSKVDLKLFFLIATFSSTSWMTLTAVWSEFPIMVLELPEGWRLYPKNKMFSMEN